MSFELPIVTVTVIDKESGNETPVNVKTCTDGVTCPEGKTMSEHLQALYEHAEDDSLHLTEEQSADLETQTGAQKKADKAKEDAVIAASVLIGAAKAEAAEDATAKADAARNAAYKYTDGKAAPLEQHATSKANPHGVTAEQVGLGNVPNKATNDLEPTYAAAEELAELTSGEKLKVAFGKIAKAVATLISHIASKSNPHSVTAKQTGALPTSGGTMNGNLTMGDGHIILTRGKNYGTDEEIPEDLPEGCLWLKVVE